MDLPSCAYVHFIPSLQSETIPIHAGTDQGICEVQTSRISRQVAHEVGKVVNPTFRTKYSVISLNILHAIVKILYETQRQRTQSRKKDKTEAYLLILNLI